MRDIRFRAWNTKEKVMLYFGDFTHTNGHLFYINDNEWLWTDESKESCDELIPMQYTGLKDKNGKKIYESDIITITYSDISHGKVKLSNKIIKWVEPFGAWNIAMVLYRNMNHRVFLEESNQMKFYIKPDIKVIGNIHEYPELIK